MSALAIAALVGAPPAFAAQSVVTFSNPAGVPLVTPDNDGRLVPTSHAFAEGGMHVESFWVPNDKTFFVQGHFHHINYGVEGQHGWESVPGLGPDRLGVMIEREDGGPFDLLSIDYRLLNQYLATDLLVSSGWDPAQPFEPQWTRYPVVKVPGMTTVPLPGYTGITRAFITLDMGLVDTNRGELDNFLVSIPAGTCSLAVPPGVVFSHQGLADPLTEGWAREGIATSVTEGPVAGDPGSEAWAVLDDSAESGSTLAYARYPSPDVMCWARTSGWSLRTRARVVDTPDAPAGSIALSLFESRWLYELRLGSDAAGDPIVSVSGTSATLTGLGGGFHDYELSYDPSTRTVDLRVDGAVVLSDVPGVTQNVSPPRVAFGSASAADTGKVHYASVEFALPPACSNGVDDDGDALADFPADPGCASPNANLESPQCDDGLDNDGDLLVDLADENCSGASDDTEAPPPPACSDGLDNDGDALADFPADPGCASAASHLENPACDDGADNDGDGFVDLADDGCTGSADDSELPPPPACSDGLDNDGDTLADFPADPGCPDAEGGTESPQCDDGLDNDGDLLVDLGDSDCASASDDDEAPPPPACANGLDDDGDTLVDFPADPGCADAASDLESPECDDGVDNDGDTLVDLADSDCASASDTVEAPPPPACANGLDDDGDGLVDFPADPGCADAASELENPQCDDGADNDGDGFADLADPDCAGAADDAELAEIPACGNGLDDDGDGRTDFPADPGCAAAADASEHAVDNACDDGMDNDGDGLVDFPADPGCFALSGILLTESPACDDDADNDGDGAVDWDGGAGAATPDPQCEGHGYAGEAPPGACGLGTELALLLPAIAALRRRRAARG